MKKGIVIGSNHYAQMVRYYIENENTVNVSILAYSIEKKYITRNVAEDGLPILPLEEFLSDTTNYDFYLAIGYSKMNTIRKNIYNTITNAGGNVQGYCHPSARISPLSKMGKGNIIFENVIIQPYVNIGNCNILQASSSILHHTILGNFNFICGGAIVNGAVTIGNCNFIGSNSTIRNRITLESNVLVGANAYVDHSLESGRVIVPNRSIILDKKSDDINI